MKPIFAKPEKDVASVLAVAALLIVAVLGCAGCADYASVGIGYSDAYYVPDYRPYYAGYLYDGYPWWGTGPYVVNRFVFRNGHRHNHYYGRHHLSRDFRSARHRSYASGGRRGSVGVHRTLRHR